MTRGYAGPSLPGSAAEWLPPMRDVCGTSQDLFEVLARWDSEGGVWVAESEDVLGLVAEADSPNHLAQKLRILHPRIARTERSSPLTGQRVTMYGTSTKTVASSHPDSQLHAPSEGLSALTDEILSEPGGETKKSGTAPSRSGVFRSTRRFSRGTQRTPCSGRPVSASDSDFPDYAVRSKGRCGAVSTGQALRRVAPASLSSSTNTRSWPTESGSGCADVSMRGNSSASACPAR